MTAVLARVLLVVMALAVMAGVAWLALHGARTTLEMTP